MFQYIQQSSLTISEHKSLGKVFLSIGLGYYLSNFHPAQAQLGTAPTAPSVPAFPTGPLPTDITPIRINEEKQYFQPGPSFYLFQKLPPRLWFNMTTEVNQRLETNVFLTKSGYSSDYVFRVLPNITMGYDLYKGISVYTDYFVIKDVYARHPVLTGPTTQSLSLGLRRQFVIGNKSTFQFDFQARELWQAAGLRQADLIPGILYSRVFNNGLVGYANIQLQMRGGNYFVAPTRELDPFYTVGLLYSRGQWLFSATNTFIDNYRHPLFAFSVPMQSNKAMIADFEIAHPVSKKVNGLVAFLRAEPVWNWNSAGVPGISGFDFRLYSGLRYGINKSAYSSTVEKMRKQLLEMQSPNNSINNPNSSLNPTETPPKNNKYETDKIALNVPLPKSYIEEVPDKNSALPANETSQNNKSQPAMEEWIIFNSATKSSANL